MKLTNIKVGIVEDEMIIAQNIAEALAEMGYQTSTPAISYTAALEMIKEEQPDLLLIDISLSGKKDGIDLAWKIKESHNIPFIFLTANSDQVTIERVKKLNPPAFLVKPFNKNELFASIEICLHNFSSTTVQSIKAAGGNYITDDSLYIKQGQSFRKICLTDLLYIESDNVYLHLFMPGAKYIVRATLPNYIDLIGAKYLFRVHRSYAVNIRKIDRIDAESIIVNGTTVPIGRSYRDVLLSMLRLG